MHTLSESGGVTMCARIRFKTFCSLDQYETPLIPSRIGPDPHNGAVVIDTRCDGDGRVGIAQARKLRT